jgi:nitrite reductase/ring-hydroxylating ferredoxin subunit
MFARVSLTVCVFERHYLLGLRGDRGSVFMYENNCAHEEECARLRLKTVCGFCL